MPPPPPIQRFSTCSRSFTVAQTGLLEINRCNSLPDLHPIHVCRRHHLRLAAAHPGQRQFGPDARHGLRLRGGKLMASSLEIFSFTRFYDKLVNNTIGVLMKKMTRKFIVMVIEIFECFRFFGLQVSPYEETKTDQTPPGILHGGLHDITK